MSAPRPVPGLPGPIWFVVTFVVYVGLGLVVKSTVLNWIVGPLWLLGSLYLLPTIFGRGRPVDTGES